MSKDEPDKDERKAPKETRLRELARRLMRELDERTEPSSAGASSGSAPAAGEASETSEASGESEPFLDDELPEDEAPGSAGRRQELKLLLGSLLASGNKTRAELIRLMAKEVRFYLEAAELDAMLHDLVTNYSLEVKASVHLKPLGEEPEPSKAEVGLKKRRKSAEEPEAE